MTNWTRNHKTPVIEKPHTLQPVDSEAIVHNINVGAIPFLQGLLMFELKRFQVCSAHLAPGTKHPLTCPNGSLPPECQVT